MSPLAEGMFRERNGDLHVRRRSSLLARGQALAPGSALAPGPALASGPALAEPAVAVRSAAADFPGAGAAALLDQLSRNGLAVLVLDEPLTDDRFAELGSLLGSPLPETDPAVQPYVSRGVLLNLVSEHDETADVRLQPFAASPLALHSEGSGRPPAEQPRFIVLMCCEPGPPGSAQTVLVPMVPVARALAGRHLDVLGRTRYRRNQAGPWICRVTAGQPVFSFRDFAGADLEWAHAGDSPGEVNDAIRALLAAMYAPDLARVTCWTRGMLMVIDNTRFFHGRTAGQAAQPGSRRHLKRLRILAAP